jgi:general secretion pathway protein G
MTIPLQFRRERATTQSRRLTPGFTLTEILIAIALIVMLVAVAVTDLQKILGGGQEDVARIFVTSEIDTALTVYKTNTGNYPTTEQGLMALIVCPDGVSGWRGPYLKDTDAPKDPWNNYYQYAYPSSHGQGSGKYDCWSMGPDGQNGTADDIGNWPSQ